jgi:Fe-Mn family superoxide dismutase
MIKLPELPYGVSALEPHLSARTLEFHHGKHHRAYVDNTNRAIVDTAYADLSLEEIVQRSWREKDGKLFNNSAQAWNHAFLWKCMSAEGGGEPSGGLKEAVKQSFGSLGEFRQRFKQAALGQFGSGWVWLTLDKGQLGIAATSNAETPLVTGLRPVLTLDVWEHAYYLDFQNARAGYVDAFLDHLINWDFASANFAELRKAA